MQTHARELGLPPRAREQRCSGCCQARRPHIPAAMPSRSISTLGTSPSCGAPSMRSAAPVVDTPLGGGSPGVPAADPAAALPHTHQRCPAPHLHQAGLLAALGALQRGALPVGGQLLEAGLRLLRRGQRQLLHRHLAAAGGGHDPAARRGRASIDVRRLRNEAAGRERAAGGTTTWPGRCAREAESGGGACRARSLVHPAEGEQSPPCPRLRVDSQAAGGRRQVGGGGPHRAWSVWWARDRLSHL